MRALIVVCQLLVWSHASFCVSIVISSSVYQATEPDSSIWLQRSGTGRTPALSPKRRWNNFACGLLFRFGTCRQNSQSKRLQTRPVSHHSGAINLSHEAPAKATWQVLVQVCISWLTFLSMIIQQRGCVSTVLDKTRDNKKIFRSSTQYLLVLSTGIYSCLVWLRIWLQVLTPDWTHVNTHWPTPPSCLFWPQSSPVT